MTTQTTEKAFEDVVESMLLAGGWAEGDRDEWDPERAVFPARMLAFLRADDPDRWARLVGQHGDGLEAGVGSLLGARHG